MIVDGAVKVSLLLHVTNLDTDAVTIRNRRISIKDPDQFFDAWIDAWSNGTIVDAVLEGE